MLYKIVEGIFEHYANGATAKKEWEANKNILIFLDNRKLSEIEIERIKDNRVVRIGEVSHDNT